MLISDSPGLDVVFDMRCLQDSNFADRGIGKVAVNLLRYARTGAGRLRQPRLVGLIDPHLLPLRKEFSDLIDVVRTTAYTGEMQRPVCCVQLSPMTHDPLFIGRLIHDNRVFKATVVYDFIPYDDPDLYFANDGAKIEYHIALRWLARSDLYLPISRGAGERLREILGVSSADIVTIGAPLDKTFEVTTSVPRVRGSHVLVIGGADRRKNVECVVKAHAAAGQLQIQRISLIITGNYPADWIASLHRLASEHGGSPDLVQFAGHVTQATLLTLYCTALTVVVPSRAEGFSLPVVEAMASGVPVLASDIPVHRELIDDSSQLFQCDDYNLLTRLLLRSQIDQQWRNTTVLAQEAVWPRFRADAVALRFWSAVETRLQGRTDLYAPSIVVGRRPKVALLSPVPPTRSGVAAHTASVCVELGRRVELHMFTETQAPQRLQGATTIRPISALPLLSSGFDRTVSVIGNSEYHLEIFNILRRYGGAVIAHDARMTGFYYGVLGHDRAIQQAGVELKRPVALHEIEGWLSDESTQERMFFGELCEAAEPLFVHSLATARLIADQYGTAAIHLPFCPYREWASDSLRPEQRGLARDRLGIAPGQVVIASFGFIAHTKAPEDCVWALDLLRSWRIDAYLHFVGHCAIDLARLRQLIISLDLEDNVKFVDEFVSEEIYRDYLLAADIGLQLRLVGMGSISGALSDCISAGLPAVANDDLADALEAPTWVTRVPNRISPVLVAEALANLLESKDRGRPNEHAHLAYLHTHNFEVYADRLCQALGLDVKPIL